MDVVAAMEFDFSGVKAREFAPVFRAVQANDLETVCAFVATTATKCPAEWGPHDKAETYFDGSYHRVVMPATKALVQYTPKLVGLEVSFAVADITGRQMQRILKTGAGDVAAQAAVLADYVRSIKGLAGKGVDHTKAEAYLDLDLGTFRYIWQQFVDELNSKN